MWINLIKTALRLLYREKVYALINTLGLSIGIGCCVVIGLYVQHELSYDQHNSNFDRIFRVVRDQQDRGVFSHMAVTSEEIAPLLEQDYPQIESAIRLKRVSNGEIMLRDESAAISWRDVYFADAEVFQFFTFAVIGGDPATALAGPDSIAISQSFAETYWGTEPALGKVLQADGFNLRVTLIYQDLPSNSHIRPSALISFQNRDQSFADQSLQFRLGVNNAYTYLRMSDDFDLAAFPEMSETFWDRYLDQQSNNPPLGSELILEPLANIHLYSTAEADIANRGNPYFVYTLVGVAFFVLLIACFNYINLSVARSIRRSREVGVRKTLGARKAQLVIQFLCESLFFVTLAYFLGLLIAEVLVSATSLPDLLGVELEVGNLFTSNGLTVLIGSLLVVGIVSGLYPALYLSSFQTVSSLKGTANRSFGSTSIRHGLVSIQFAFSMTVISSALIMYSQMQFVNEKPLGFEKDNKIVVRIVGEEVIRSIPAIKAELTQHNSVLGVADTDSPDGITPGSRRVFSVEGNEGSMMNRQFYNNMVGENYVEVLGMNISEGRDFDGGNFKNSVLVNEAVVRAMEWDIPVGKTISDFSGDLTVIGVVSDFNFHGLTRQVEPYILLPEINDRILNFIPEESRSTLGRNLIISIDEANQQQTIQFLQEVFESFDPSRPFEYTFLDGSLDAQYTDQQNQLGLVGVFASICVFVSCLGVFGLAAISTGQRAKEIGIRKVLGASVSRIILMLFRHMILIVAAASIVAAFLSFIAMSQWLEVFYYRIDINPLVFLVAAAVSMSLAFVTMTAQSYRTAMANPIESLHYE